jgi:isoquinoline 1-oxidoreductase
MKRRDFFKILGGGIVVILIPDDSDAQESGGGRRRGFNEPMPTALSAWLHIGENGIVTVYTGKVEVGQNARTSLTQAVAEELHAPVASIRMVMGDTDLTPFDMGTVGSMTTPRMWPQIRKAAATAREMLVDLAAQKWSVDRASVTIDDGKVSANSHSAAFGELTKGQKLTQTIPTSAAVTPATEWKVAGTSVPQGQRPRNRQRLTQVHLRYEAAGHAVRQGAASAVVRRNARLAR